MDRVVANQKQSRHEQTLYRIPKQTTQLFIFT